MDVYVRALFIGDIVGRPGRLLVLDQIKQIKEQYRIQIAIANAENAAGGMGLTAEIAHELHAAGIDAITLGNHVWDQRGFEQDIDTLPYVCRPANLLPQAPGRPYLIVEKNGFKLCIFTLLGRHNLGIEVDQAAKTADQLIHQLKDQVQAFFVEIHAELTAEKQMMGLYLDGRVAAVVGTHTHVPTADERILPKGTAFQTDVGMTGVRQSVIGFDAEPILAKLKDGLPRRWEVAQGDAHIDACMVDIDPQTGLAISFQRLCIRG